MPMNSVVTICDKEDDDVVDSKVLDWAGLRELWDAHEEILSNYSVVQNILPMCCNVDIETEEWDAGVPGRSGIYFSIETSYKDHRVSAEVHGH